MKTRSNRLNNGYVGGNFLDTSQYGVLPINKQATSNEWTRPTDWLSLPSMVEGDSKIAGLVAVYPGDTGSTGITASSNFVAFTVNGNYTVNWGDGTSQSYLSGVTAYKQYLWEGASASTVTSYGFRQRVFQITPQAGAVLTRANFIAYYPGVTLQLTNGANIGYSSAILDLKISGASLAGFTLAKATEQFEYVGDSNILSCEQLFFQCNFLRRVIGTSWTKKSTVFSNMFNSCTLLRTVPLFDTKSGKFFDGMFGQCSSLQTVPLFDTKSGILFSAMFNYCTLLQTVPLFNTTAGTGFSNMFNGCKSLYTVPLFDTKSGTNFASMFGLCSSLHTVPLFNTIAGKQFYIMFDGCKSLHTVPLFNTTSADVDGFQYMFRDCSSLKTVPLFNTMGGGNFQYMFSGCTLLQTVPLFNTTAATTFSSMFSGCPNLKSAALAQPSRDLNYTNCALSAAELNRIFANLKMVGSPLGGFPAGTGIWRNKRAIAR